MDGIPKSKWFQIWVNNKLWIQPPAYNNHFSEVPFRILMEKMTYGEDQLLDHYF